MNTLNQRIAHKAHEEGTTLREAALSLGDISAEEFDALVEPARLAHPHSRDGRTS